MKAEGDGTIELVVRRTIRASVERVFEAWTTPEALRAWWGPKGVVCTAAEIDLRVGGSYRIGNRHPGGRVSWIVGEFELVAPPRKLIYSWRIEPSADATPDERVTVRFEPHGDDTEVIVVHQKVQSRESRDGHEQGWEGCLDGLETFLPAK